MTSAVITLVARALRPIDAAKRTSCLRTARTVQKIPVVACFAVIVGGSVCYILARGTCRTSSRQTRKVGYIAVGATIPDCWCTVACVLPWRDPGPCIGGITARCSVLAGRVYFALVNVRDHRASVALIPRRTGVADISVLPLR